MVGPSAIVSVEFEATTRALAMLACLSRVSTRVSGVADDSCCSGLSVLGMSSAVSRK